MPPSDDGARLIAVFDSIHHVLAAERVFRQHSLWCDLVPTPRQVSSDCGMVIEFREADAPATRAVLTDPRVRCQAIYRRIEDTFQRVHPQELS